MNREEIIKRTKEWCKTHRLYFVISSLDNGEDVFYNMGIELRRSKLM